MDFLRNRAASQSNVSGNKLSPELFRGDGLIQITQKRVRLWT